MTDREKVIRLIEEEINVCESVNQCYRTIDLPVLRDILALLKEQENMIPITVIAEYLARYAAPPVRSPLAVYGDLVTAWERFLKDLNRR